MFMTPDILLVLAILGSTIVLFILDRFRLDLVVLLALLLTNTLTPQEALAGLSDPVVIMIAGLFVVGAAIFETGIADAAGRQLARVAGVSLTRLMIVIMVFSLAMKESVTGTWQTTAGACGCLIV